MTISTVTISPVLTHTAPISTVPTHTVPISTVRISTGATSTSPLDLHPARARRSAAVRGPSGSPLAGVLLGGLLLGGFLLAVLPLAGCAKDEPEPVAESPIAPITSRDAGARGTASGPGGPTASATGSRSTPHWTLPAGWQEQPPSSPMRMAEIAIPGPGGEAQLVVFYFGPGQGGAVEDNIARWIGQVEGGAAPQRGELDTSGGYHATWVDVAGTLKPSMMGAGPQTAQPDSRLLGAVVEGAAGGDGPWFFKATGPASTLAAARGDFLAFLRSLGPAA